MARKHYIDNSELYVAMQDYYEKNQKAKAAGEESPQVPRYIAECLMKIAENLSTNPNFIGYSFREEMVADGILNCLRYGVKAFDPNKTNNPFAYFTQINWYAFVRRIDAEKKQMYVKYKNYDRMNLLDSVDGIDIQTTELNDQINSFVKTYETKLTETKKAAKIKRDSKKAQVSN